MVNWARGGSRHLKTGVGGAPSARSSRPWRREPIRLTKDLIIVRAGTRSLHTAWLDPGKARNWDLFICPSEALPPPPAGAAGLLVSQAVPGTKWEGLKLLLHKWQGWREYRYVMLADEDLYAPQNTWSRFFERCAAGAAKLAQPAFAEDAPYRHWVTVRNSEFKVRRVSCVDAAMPCFRADALAALLPTFDLSTTGWGLDFMWGHRLDYKDVFVIDETPVISTRPFNVDRDPALHQAAQEALNRFMRDNKVPWLLKTFSGTHLSGLELAATHEAFLYRLFRGYENMFERNPKRIEEMFRLQLAPAPVG
jgi:hypothetical protein